MQFIVPWLVVKLVVPVPLIFGLLLVAAPQFLKQIVASPTVPGTSDGGPNVPEYTVFACVL